MDKYDTLRKKNSKFPLLSGKSHFKSTRSLLPSAAKKSSFTSTQSIEATNKLFLKRIDDLEKFLKSVVQH
jgi:hypothetical protein